MLTCFSLIIFCAMLNNITFFCTTYVDHNGIVLLFDNSKDSCIMVKENVLTQFVRCDTLLSMLASLNPQ